MSVDTRPSPVEFPILTTHLWDNGADAVTELKRMMTVRAYTMRSDGVGGPVAIPAAQQATAIDTVSDVQSPANLSIPRKVLAQLPPRPYLIEPTRELFGCWTGMTFDPLSPGVTIANVTFDLLLDSRIRGWIAGAYKPAKRRAKLSVPPGSPIGDQ